MHKIIFVVILYLFSAPVFSQIYIDPGFGAVFKDNTGNLSPRFNIGAHNLLFKRFGVYGTIEVVRVPDQKFISETDERDIVGGIIRVNDILSIYGGAGVFSNGIFANNFNLKVVRKEAGISVNIPKAKLNIDLGYSTSSGLSGNIGYVIPLSKSKVVKDNQTNRNPLTNKKNETVQQSAPKEILDPKSTIITINKDGIKSEGESGALSAPVDISQLQSPSSETDVFKSAPDLEYLKPGFYAINGVFRNRQNAQEEVIKIRRTGFPKAQVGFRSSTGLYYVWLMSSKNEQEIRNFVLENRKSRKLPGVWMMRID